MKTNRIASRRKTDCTACLTTGRAGTFDSPVGRGGLPAHSTWPGSGAGHRSLRRPRRSEWVYRHTWIYVRFAVQPATSMDRIISSSARRPPFAAVVAAGQMPKNSSSCIDVVEAGRFLQLSFKAVDGAFHIDPRR